MTLVSSIANAAGPTKFYATILELPPDASWPSGKPYLAIGLHPTSPEIARANACLPLESSTAGWVEQCLTATTSLKCGNGGYFAVAGALSYLIPPVYSPAGWFLSNPPAGMAYGVACGRASDEVARKEALAACTGASKKKGIPEPFIGTRDNDPQFHNCQIYHSGLNDGTLKGEVTDFKKIKAALKPNEFLTSIRYNCWGKASAEFESMCPK